MRFGDSFLFAGIGFGAHMFEDALIANPAYAFFWPISGQKFGIGLFDYRPDLYGIASTDVLIVGVIFMVLCGGIRAFYEGKEGIRRIARTVSVAGAIMILMVPMFIALDINVMEKIHSNGYGKNKWIFTQNASWDSTVFHSGNHSAKIEIQGNESKISGMWISNHISVKPNTTYVFSVWGKTKGAGGGSPALRIIEQNDNDEKWFKPNDLGFEKGSNDWMRKEIKFVTFKNTSKIYIYANIWKGYGTFWFDDVELYEGGNFNNLITNSGFEDGFESNPLPREK